MSSAGHSLSFFSSVFPCPLSLIYHFFHFLSFISLSLVPHRHFSPVFCSIWNMFHVHKLLPVVDKNKQNIIIAEEKHCWVSYIIEDQRDKKNFKKIPLPKLTVLYLCYIMILTIWAVTTFCIYLSCFFHFLKTLYYLLNSKL